MKLENETEMKEYILGYVKPLIAAGTGAGGVILTIIHWINPIVGCLTVLVAFAAGFYHFLNNRKDGQIKEIQRQEALLKLKRLQDEK